MSPWLDGAILSTEWKEARWDKFVIDAEIAEMMKEVRNIAAHMQPVILELYSRFLADRADDELWQFSTPGDEVTASLAYANYMSTADLVFCQSCDINSLAAEPGFAAMQSLHEALVALNPPELDDAA